MTTHQYRKETIMENEELVKITREWQSRLRLNDWIIEAWVARRKDFPEGCGDAEGLVNYNIEKKHAEIIVLHPDDAPEFIPHDMESILVHELLHCHFAPFSRDDDPLNVVFIEQAIESITHALMTMERGQVERFTTSQDQTIADQHEAMREIQKDRDRYREKVLRLQEDLKQKDKDLISISKLRQETFEENRKLKRLYEQMKAEVEDFDMRASAEYHQGVEDALRRHDGFRHVDQGPQAEAGAPDVSNHRIKALFPNAHRLTAGVFGPGDATVTIERTDEDHGDE